MPIFTYECEKCNERSENIVIPSWSNFKEPETCLKCGGHLFRVINAPAIRFDGKWSLKTLPDPVPPLQKLKEQGPKEGCEGGFADLPEFKPTERRRTKDGNWEWYEKERKIFDMGKR